MSKARMVATPGNELTFIEKGLNLQSAAVDENYMVIGAHLDNSVKQKIVNHEYVDFSRLLPQDRVTREEDHRMELVNRGGSTFFIPVADRENQGGITGFPKWEQVFRIFSNVYTKYYPDRATELIQYNHIIFTAAQTFAWDNVYLYDKEFRMHLSNYPQRSWAVILQQAWSMYLKDRIWGGSNNDEFKSGGANPRRGRREPCKRFNKGLCTAGVSCKFDHRCTVKECGKWGHGARICRKCQNNVGSSPATNAQAANAPVNNRGQPPPNRST